MRSRSLWTALALASCAAPTAAEDVGTQCYFVNGAPSTNSFRCDNSTTGHTTCCQAGAVCYSNGVCKLSNGGIIDWQRVGCTDPTWQDPSCLNRCQQYASGSSAGIRFCDSTITSGNRYCCDPGPIIGSFSCCKNNSNIFELPKSPPTILAQMPLNQVTIASTSSATATSSSTAVSSSAAATSSVAPSQTGNATASNSTAIGLGVGLGVGIPILLVIAGALFYHRRKTNQQNATLAQTQAHNPATQHPGPVGSAYQPSTYSSRPPDNGWGYGAPMQQTSDTFHGGAYAHAQEAQAGAMPKYGGPPFNAQPIELSHYNNPAELPGLQSATELPSSPYR